MPLYGWSCNSSWVCQIPRFEAAAGHHKDPNLPCTPTIGGNAESGDRFSAKYMDVAVLDLGFSRGVSIPTAVEPTSAKPREQLVALSLVDHRHSLPFVLVLKPHLRAFAGGLPRHMLGLPDSLQLLQRGNRLLLRVPALRHAPPSLLNAKIVSGDVRV